MDVTVTVIGTLLVVAGLRDVFHTIWHPGGFGELTRFVFVVVWRVVGRLPRSPLHLAGPLGVIATLGLWAWLLAAGFAMIYLPGMPEDFSFGSSLDPEASSDVVASWYFSMVSVTTLGFGDIQPADPLLRILVPLQALFGFLLLTAGISWMLQIYPALSRRRSLARRLSTLRKHGFHRYLADGMDMVEVLESIRSDLAGIEMDLTQHHETYYFREPDAEVSLAATLPYVVDLAQAASVSSRDDVRLAGQLLESALADLRTVVAGRLPRSVDGEDVFDAFARDHRHRSSAR